MGTPIGSAITSSGSSAATSVTKSHSPLGPTRSMISLACRRVDSSRVPTMRGVKPLLTSSRSFVCLGGSMFSMIIRVICNISSFSGSTNSAPRSSDENVVLLCDTWMTSACLVTTQ